MLRPPLGGGGELMLRCSATAGAACIWPGRPSGQLFGRLSIPQGNKRAVLSALEALFRVLKADRNFPYSFEKVPNSLQFNQETTGCKPL